MDQLPQESFNTSVDASVLDAGVERLAAEADHEQSTIMEDVKPFYQGGPRAVHQCNVCDKIFVTYKGLQQHALIHTDQRPFSCETCGKTFRFKSNLFEHRSLHSKFKAHACPFCGKTCRLKGNLKKHLRTHVDTPEELEEAWKPFASNRRPPAEVPPDAIILRSNGNLVYPATPVRMTGRRHLGLGDNKAVWINKIRRGDILPTATIEEKLEQFRNALSLLQSNGVSLKAVLNKAKMIAFESFDCPICAACFNSRGECSEHLDLEHPLARVERPLFCEICLKSFDDRKTLEQHESYHKRVHLLVENGDLELTDPEPMVPKINDISSNAFDDENKQQIMDQLQIPPISHDSNDQTQNSNPLSIKLDPSQSLDAYYGEQNSVNQVHTSNSIPAQQNSFQSGDGQLF